MKLLFWIISFFSACSVTAQSWDRVPVLYEGRYRPFGTLPVEEQNVEKALFLPIAAEIWEQNAGEWLPLSYLKDSHNFTPYSESLYASLQQAYLKKDDISLITGLLEGYLSLAGTAFKESTHQNLYYPTIFQLNMEYFLHRFPLSMIALGAYLIATLFYLFKKFRWGNAFLVLGFIFHTVLLCLRCYILKRPPVATMTESILYVPWIGVVVSLFFLRSKWTPLAACLASVVLLFLLPKEQSFTNVQAVLNSRSWLVIHVMMVVGSYGLFFLSGILGHFFLLKRTPSISLEKGVLYSMFAGTALLIGGTILGGVWAAESWGRFWDWDPKESWAFISSGVYLLWIHAYHFKKIRGKGLAIGSILGLMAITFTWYGVNYILGTGLHSYGFGNGGEMYYYFYLIAETLFLLFLPLFKKYNLQKIGS